MSNMSYCRFQNTDNDLRDCEGALEELFNADHGKLSQDELRAAKSLVERCLNIVQMIADQARVDFSVEDVLNVSEKVIDNANAQCDLCQHLKERGFEMHNT